MKRDILYPPGIVVELELSDVYADVEPQQPDDEMPDASLNGNE